MSRPRKLTRAVIRKAEELATLGLPRCRLAEALGVCPATMFGWLKAARDGTGGPLEHEFLEAIQRGGIAWETTMLQRLQDAAAKGDSRAITWALSHAPETREAWSDAAAVRREVQRVLSAVVEVVCGSPIALDDQRDLLLALQARGLAAEPPALPPADG